MSNSHSTGFILPNVAKFSKEIPLFIAAAGEMGQVALIRGDVAIQQDKSTYLVNSFTACYNTILDLVFLPGSDTICIGSGSHNVHFVDISECKQVSTHVGHTGSVKTLCLCERSVISGGRDGLICCWDQRQPNPITKKPLKTKATVSSLVSPDPLCFISGDSHGELLVWDTRTFKPIYKVPNADIRSKSGISSLSLSPDGQRMASLSTSDSAFLHTLDSTWRKAKFPCRGLDSYYNRVSFSPDSEFIVTGSSNGSVNIFSTTYAHEPVHLLCHTAPCTSVDWADTFSFFVSCSDDKSIQLWEANTNVCDEPFAEQLLLYEPTDLKQPKKDANRGYTLHRYV